MIYHCFNTQVHTIIIHKMQIEHLPVIGMLWFSNCSIHISSTWTLDAGHDIRFSNGRMDHVNKTQLTSSRPELRHSLQKGNPCPHFQILDKARKPNKQKLDQALHYTLIINYIQLFFIVAMGKFLYFLYKF